MSEEVPSEEQGGDPPCWAAQFADVEGDEEDGDDGAVERAADR
jgi:hypothetical protein